MRMQHVCDLLLATQQGRIDLTKESLIALRKEGGGKNGESGNQHPLEAPNTCIFTLTEVGESGPRLQKHIIVNYYVPRGEGITAALTPMTGELLTPTEP